MNIMLVSKNLSDDVVYDLLGGIYSDKGLETIGASHATAKREIKLDTALRGITGTSVKLHPGAEKFYKDKGAIVQAVGEDCFQPAAQDVARIAEADATSRFFILHS